MGVDRQNFEFTMNVVDMIKEELKCGRWEEGVFE